MQMHMNCLIMITFYITEKINNQALRDECPVDCTETAYHSKLSSSSFIHNPPTGVHTTILENAVRRKKENTSYLLELKKRYNDTELDRYIE